MYYILLTNNALILQNNMIRLFLNQAKILGYKIWLRKKFQGVKNALSIGWTSLKLARPWRNYLFLALVLCRLRTLKVNDLYMNPQKFNGIRAGCLAQCNGSINAVLPNLFKFMQNKSSLS